VIDARKNEVFWAMYRPVPGGVQQVSPPTVGPIDDLVGDLLARSQDVLCIGDGAERFRDEINEGYRCEVSGPRYPSVAMLVLLAHARALREEWVRPDEIEPVYLRPPDAQINWAVRGARP
jgi:tRNA threonylcarbamoyladenosine biosynthesis protein TsaB